MRRAVVSYALAALGFLGVPCASQAQGSYDPSPFIPKFDLSAGYNFIHANDPPGGTHKFNTDGTYVSVGYNWKYWLGFAGEATGSKARNISPLGQDLNLLSFAGGPRVRVRLPRFSPYGQLMFGMAHAWNSYFPNATSYSTSANSFAGTVGGGIDYNLSHRFGARAEAQYLHTTFNNGVNTSQNQLMLDFGVVVKFHGYFATPYSYRHKRDLPLPQTEAPTIPTPTTPLATIAVPAMSPPPTPPMNEAPPSPLPTQPAVATLPPSAHPIAGIYLTELYFDYDKADLRSDSQASLQAVVAYLQDHSSEHWRIVGYSDERGTAQYNISLGERRANAVRDALVSAGIDSDRISVVSYGNAVQVCTKPSEPCYRRNRRVEFLPQP